MRRLVLILIFVLIGGVDAAFATNICVGLTTGARQSTFASNSNIDGTDDLIAYLTELQKGGTLTDKEIAAWMTDLQNGNISNPISEEKTQVSSAAMVQREAIQGYIDQRTLDLNRLRTWAEHLLNETSRIRRARKATKTETEYMFQKMQFNRVPAGSFEFGESQNRRTITLTHPFEMMSTKVTQKMWTDVMGKNSSRQVDGEDTATLNIHGKFQKMQPNNPADSMTWYSAAEFANRLSKQHGFKPTYDFKYIRFERGTSPEKGNWGPEQSEVAYYHEVIVKAHNQDIYRAEGFRLPTFAESQYMISMAKKAMGKHPIDDYVWSLTNSEKKTHPVATLRPLMIDGQYFYDLMGNVWEWNGDGYDGQFIHSHNLDLFLRLKIQGTDPHTFPTDNARLLSGSSGFYAGSKNHTTSPAKDRQISIGFRIVRTVK